MKVRWVSGKRVKSNILIFGGLGEPKTSVIGLYSDLLKTLQGDYNLVVIDPKLESIDLTSHSEMLGVGYSSCFRDLNDYTHHRGKVPIAAIFILTPLGSHYSILRELAAFTQLENALIVLEKPSFALDEVDLGFSTLVPQLNKRNVTVYFIDTAMVSPVFDCERIKNVFETHGLPEKIVALAMDNPMERYGDWGAYSFERKLPAINRRKLLSLADSGGAGLGLDMGVHAMAGLMRLLSVNNFAFKDITIKNVRLEALDVSGLERDAGAETQAFMEATINGISGCIALSFVAGKGGAIWDRRVELYYENLVITVSFGTLKSAPYIGVLDGNKLAVETFEILNSGYVQHHNDILSLLSNKPTNTPNVSPELSQDIMKKTMSVMKRMYDFSSEDAELRERLIEKVDVHSISFLGGEHKVNSERINEYFRSNHQSC
ncbi:hypothetical protein J4N42_21855 [Vibrio sp. SCSIO 43135]|uniref:hypothetical protein n=1 Tax=Vibrio sp. SCSIO 43135 TaxID=2819096 RepID=UPI00207573AF|nr:hypothetical protein [Vibrio sp. SCSIO 43135]USD43237.1 hypothetical protein J4N42_21855 [Vibrio sp. SCSIO 43135]